VSKSRSYLANDGMR